MNKKELKRLKKLSKKKGSLYGGKDKNGPKMKNYYQVTLSNFEFHLIELILMINFIPTKEYMFASKSGTVLEKFDFNKKFRELSAIDWDVATAQDSPAFRAKFLTRFLFWILNNDEKIIENVVKYKDPKKPYWVRRGVLKTIIVRVDLFITAFLARDYKYGDKLYDLNELITIKSCSNSQVKINKRFSEQIHLVNDYFDGIGDITEAMLWHTIIRLAYIMVDGKENLGDLPKFKDVIDVNDPDEIKEIIGRLGVALLINKNKKRVSEIYKIWEKSGALITSNYGDVDELVELQEGTKALHYLAFIIDNPKFTEYINRII